MATYLLRAIKQVAVYELTGKERVVEAETEAQLHIKTRQFLTEEFPGEMGPEPGIEVEIKKTGEDVSITERKPSDEFRPVNKSKHNPGAPF